jgi:hypothetical protein
MSCGFVLLSSSPSQALVFTAICQALTLIVCLMISKVEESLMPVDAIAFFIFSVPPGAVDSCSCSCACLAVSSGFHGTPG